MNDKNGTATTTRAVTVNQVVAWNVAYYRKAAGLTQKELGDRIGWTNVAVSDAERSWEGRRVREFDAQDLANLSLALRVPLAALLLPPEGGAADGAVIAGAGGGYGFGELLALVVMPDSGDESPAARAYRERLRAAATRYLAPRWAQEVARLLGGAGGAWTLGDHALRLRARQAEAARVAQELGDMASAIERRGRLR